MIEIVIGWGVNISPSVFCFLVLVQRKNNEKRIVSVTEYCMFQTAHILAKNSTTSRSVSE